MARVRTAAADAPIAGPVVSKGRAGGQFAATASDSGRCGAGAVGLLMGRHQVSLTDWVSPVLLAAALTGLALAPPGSGRRTSVADHLRRISYSICVWHVLVIGLVAVTVDATLGLQPWGPART